jgi:protein-tyrosine kinase
MSRIEKALEKATKMRDDQKVEEHKKVEGHKTATHVAGGELPDAFRVDEPVQLENPYMISAREPGSPISEEYKKLKSFILKITQSDKFLNTIMVSSSVKGEGKSITALNLAITLAEEYDHTVLLVDADLRQPSIHKYLGIPNEIGLSDCLMNGVSASDAMIKTGIGKLVVLPSGSEINNPVEVLSSNKMRDLVKELKERYPDRYVIFDTPPLLPFAESHAIASSVDGILLVVRDGYTSLNNLKETLNIIKNTNILGIVYNDVEIDRFDGYHYYHYYKSYYSDKNKEQDGNGEKGGLLKFFKRSKT